MSNYRDFEYWKLYSSEDNPEYWRLYTPDALNRDTSPRPLPGPGHTPYYEKYIREKYNMNNNNNNNDDNMNEWIKLIALFAGGLVSAYIIYKK